MTKEQFIKIGKGALIAGGGVFAVYFLEDISVMDFGQSTPLVSAVCSILINAIYQIQKDSNQK